jgi:DeoR/GlpR family transcriptional regulator of sugar metabolism
VAPLNAVHTLVTDEQTAADFVEALSERGIQVVQV